MYVAEITSKTIKKFCITLQARLTYIQALDHLNIFLLQYIITITYCSLSGGSKGQSVLYFASRVLYGNVVNLLNIVFVP